MNRFFKKLYGTPLFRDSFWSVVGNGSGNMLLLLAGIIMARLLGKDVYGEYGLVKTTMFHVASFATFGLVYTSTKFIAQYIEEDKSKIIAIVKASLMITLLSSSLLCILLFVFSGQLASFINEPRLESAFRYLGVIIVIRALVTTIAGVLGGFKEYRKIGLNSVASGITLLSCAVPLTFFYGITGSLISLLFSQLVNCVLNFISLYKVLGVYWQIRSNSFNAYNLLLGFSVPVAIQELSWSICHWGNSLLMAKYASLGEVGIYSAASQWGAITMYIPALLSNVVLSHLSGVSEGKTHVVLLKKMVFVYFISSLIPVILVLFSSRFIVSMYGNTFVEMRSVLNIIVLSTIFTCLAQVYQSDLISRGKNWQLLFLRLIRDILGILSVYFVLQLTKGVDAAYYYSIITLCVSIIYFTFISLVSIIGNRRHIIQDEKE